MKSKVKVDTLEYQINTAFEEGLKRMSMVQVTGEMSKFRTLK